MLAGFGKGLFLLRYRESTACDLFGKGFVEFGVEAFDKYTARLDDPSVQLDHRDNPYRPSGTNNFEEFDVYMDRYAAEQELLEDYDLISLLTNSDGEDVLKQLTDSEFEAFYNTMMMFKLVLMGPENFTKFLEYFGIENYGIKRAENYEGAEDDGTHFWSAVNVGEGSDRWYYYDATRLNGYFNGNKSDKNACLITEAKLKSHKTSSGETYFYRMTKAYDFPTISTEELN